MAIKNRADIARAKRIVVKVGSSSISGANENAIAELTESLAKAHARGAQVILVSSGAIANGMPLLGITARPEDLATSQALAAVGQSRLIARYQAGLERFNIVAGQVLLTADGFEDQEQAENAKRAIERLLELRVLPIVNENDTVATAEIRFGDNDRLAALVTILTEADVLVLLSDIDALYDMPPNKPGARRLDVLTAADDLDSIEVGGTSTGFGTGGAVTKVAAAKLATESGIPVLLTSTAQVAAALNGDAVGTWFESRS